MGKKKSGKKDQYPVTRYTGVPVEDDGNGGWRLRRDAQGAVHAHEWRTGKHSRGNYRGPGQLLLTENNLMVMIVAAVPLAFKDRHQVVPYQRLLDAQASEQVLAAGRAAVTGGNQS